MNPGLFPGAGDGLLPMRPLRVVTYTSGTGTFTPLAANSWCRVTLVGGGAGGRRGADASGNGGGGGGGGQTVTAWIRISGSVSYAVGSGGLGATASNTWGAGGGQTQLGPLVAFGGYSSSSFGVLYGSAGGGFQADGGPNGISVAGGGGGIVGYPQSAATVNGYPGAPAGFSVSGGYSATQGLSTGGAGVLSLIHI